MKVTRRFTVRAALVLTAAGVIGAFGACKKDAIAPPPPPPSPPPPPTVAAPSALVTAPTANSVALSWTDNATNETGFRVERCTGAGCTSFAQIGTDLAANAVAYTDNGLTASTSYSYRVRAFNAAAVSAWTSTVTTATLAASQSFTMIGAGEITSCASSGNTQTAALIQNAITADATTIVFTTGDNVATGVQNSGSYTTCFDPSWGRFKDRMQAAVGDGDFESIGVDGVYAYFGDKAGAPNGWYSFEVGPSWHVIVLNTGLWQHGSCALTGTDGGAHPECAGVATPQLDWLANDLANTTKTCIMAISWDRRIYTAGGTPGGSLGKNMNMNSIARMLYGAGVDLLVSGKDKQYERFPKTNVDGALDAAGFAQFIIGTGGRSLDAMHTPAAGNPVAAQFARPVGAPANWAESWGVVKFTLNASSYKWEFISTLSSGGFTDSGETACN